MKNTKVLEMLNNGEIEQLKALLTEEIYKDNLGNNSSKQRYSAMKKYFKYADGNNKALSMPCKNVSVYNETYNSFIDGYCFALTKESIGELESFNSSDGKYFDIARLINFTVANSVENIDLNNILAEAKSKGYKYKKSEIGTNPDFKYIFKYKDTYYKIGLLDKAYSIINDGKNAETYYTNNKSILLIKTSIGIAGLLPINASKDIEHLKTVINTENE